MVLLMVFIIINNIVNNRARQIYKNISISVSSYNELLA